MRHQNSIARAACAARGGGRSARNGTEEFLESSATENGHPVFRTLTTALPTACDGVALLTSMACSGRMCGRIGHSLQGAVCKYTLPRLDGKKKNGTKLQEQFKLAFP